jgi:hypothetical protein
MLTVANGPTIPSVACAHRHLGSPPDGQPLPMTSRRFIDRTMGADRSNWQPSASSMIRPMLRAHRPHFGRQPKHLYTWPVVVGSGMAVVTMVRTSRSRTLQEQIIMKASPGRRPYTGSKGVSAGLRIVRLNGQSAARRAGEMRHAGRCPILGGRWSMAGTGKR